MATVTATTDGDASDGSSWDTASVPGIGDDVVIAGHLINVTADMTWNSLNIDGSTLDLFDGVTLTIVTDVVNNGSGIGCSAADATGTLVFGGSLTMTNDGAKVFSGDEATLIVQHSGGGGGGGGGASEEFIEASD